MKLICFHRHNDHGGRINKTEGINLKFLLSVDIFKKKDEISSQELH